MDGDGRVMLLNFNKLISYVNGVKIHIEKGVSHGPQNIIGFGGGFFKGQKQGHNP